ncbi:YhdP family protein [Thiomicrorhabdus aquaedulcis]|uniref:YhdP family phospholipid transporter n=1 Tax=Thiomicrorhabdus aquaedulcis TaxID=2211106 RepID=UPI000FDBFFD9|nr:AsmA-like C-terminal region-containing protein [Thiomicrorhabdus aquaedulcis]
MQGNTDFKGWVDANLGFQANSLADLKTYLPYKLMSQTLQDWLKTGLVSGESIQGNAVLKGHVAQFPFNNGQGSFMATAQVHKVKLLFDQAWPMLQDFSAKLVFTPYQLNIQSDSVAVGDGLQATNVVVDIDNLHRSDIAVKISGEVTAPMDKASQYLINSPLAKNLGLSQFLQGQRNFGGAVNVKLNEVWVPVLGYDKQVETVQGQVEFKNAEFNLAEMLRFTQLNGVLTFNEKSAASSRLSARVLGMPANFDLTTDPKNKVVRLSGSGAAKLTQNGVFQHPIPWNAQAFIPFGGSSNASTSDINVNIQADVSTAKSLMPAPLSAQAFNQQMLSLELRIKEDNLSLNATLPKTAHVQSQWRIGEQDYQLQSGHLQWGSKPLSLTHPVSNSGLSMAGIIHTLNIKEWFDFYTAVISSQLESADEIVWPNWQASTVSINEVHYKDTVYPQLNVAWESDTQDNINLNVTSPDIVANALWKPQGLGTLEMNVEHFTFYVPTQTIVDAKEQESKQASCIAEPSKSQWPNILFSGQNIFINERLINRLSFELNDTQDSLTVNALQGQFGSNAGEFVGNYHYHKQNQLSEFNLSLTSQDVEAVTDFIGLEKGFTGKQANANTKLNWNGSADCFTVQSAQAKLDFTLTDGAIADIEPGFARLLGLLSVDSLARRLKLDLKDVTHQGMTYDTIKGNAQLEAGLLKFKEFAIKAPAANVKLFGEVNLIDETFNLQADVTPTIGGSLPTIAALAGAASPVTALALYAILKIMPGLTEELITYNYKINGPWKEPNIEPVNINNTDKSQ